jgi:hypothetical protein
MIARSQFELGGFGVRLAAVLIVSGLMGIGPARVAKGQGVLAPPPLDYQEKPATFQPWGTNQASAGAPLINPPEEIVPDFLDWGPVKARPHVLYRFLYGDGVLSAPGDQNKTAINEIYPGITFDIGQRWRLDYTPTLRYYSNSKFRDTLDHSVALSGNANYEAGMYSLLQTYVTSSQPLAETGGQTETETYVTGLNGAWQLGSRMSLEVGLNQNFRFVGQTSATNSLVDSMNWSTMDWLNYQVWPKVGFGIGLGGGYNDVSAGADMTYEQVQGRVTCVAGTKLSLMASGGIEVRQFQSSGAPNLINPILNLALSYLPFDGTTLTVTGSRVVDASFYQDQVTEIAAIGGGIRQRLFGKLYLDLSGGYQQTTYKATIQGGYFIAFLHRQDESPYFSARLSTSILKRGTISVFVQHSENTSNAAGYTYTSTQVGFELGYRL